MEAEDAVNQLDKGDVAECKKFVSPTDGVALTLKCVLVYLGNGKTDWTTA